MKVVVVLLFYTFLGLTLAWGRYSKAGIGETPIIYKSVVVQFICNMSMLGFVAMILYLMFTDVKLLLILVAGGFLLGYKLLVPIVEKMLKMIIR